MVSGTTTGRVGVWLLAVLMTAVIGGAAAQSVCELPLVVPDRDEIQVELRSTSRGPGLLMTWPEPADDVSTCASLVGTDGFGIPVTLSGDYQDRFDRSLQFRFNGSGAVGDQTQNRFVASWSNVNISRTGLLGGEINLANTGGLWIRDGGGTWTQRNDGLPYYLPYTNLTGFARSSDGTLVCALSSGSDVLNDPVGVFVASPSGAWTEVAPETFGKSRRLLNAAIDPSASQRFAIGTRDNGLYVTGDGGASFTQWTSNLDPDMSSPATFYVGAISWTDTRLVVSVRDFGVFVSEDGGQSFATLENLMVPTEPGSSTMVRPRVLTILEDPADSDRLLVGLTDHGVWESTDAGANWSSLLVDYAGPPENWRYSVQTLAIHPSDPDVIIAGTLAQLIWRTGDGGASWAPSTTPFDGDEVKPSILDVVTDEGDLLALTAGAGLLESADGGVTWTVLADTPLNTNAQLLVTAGEELLLPTTGGGIYVPGSVVPISATILSSVTDAELRDLELGLSIAFDEGRIDLVDGDGDGAPDPQSFNVVAQDYQGWIVWRSERGNPDGMVMIGRYDKNNPESCIEGFCGDENFTILPNCFSERRAACFDLSVPGYVSFYDDDIFNGFTYYYAITPFDFGDISTIVDPVSIDSPMVFPPRFADDTSSIGAGEGNRFDFQVNTAAAAAVDGQEIYVYPNPLRLGSGIVGGEGEEVIWTNLPPDSKIEIFTLAGDEIAKLPEDGEPQQGGNMYWVARNSDNRLLASGIYLWRVIMPERGDFWGKLVIIR